MPDRFGLKERLMDELLFLEPRTDLDQFIVGVGTGFGGAFALVYDKDGLLEFWKNEYLKEEDDIDEEAAYFMAVEWFEYNTIGAYMGEHTPIYVSKDEFDIFMEDYEVMSSKQHSIHQILESMSISEIGLWREAFDMAQSAGFSLPEDNWVHVLEGFLKKHRETQYLQSLERWVELRNSYPKVFTAGDQPPLPMMDSSFDHSPESSVLGWKETLSFKEKADLLDSQFKRDFARVVGSAILQKSTHVPNTENTSEDLPSN